MQQARWCTLLTVILCCSACSAPSLRYKKEVNRLISDGQFSAAVQRVEKAKHKEYNRRDRLLYDLDRAALLHEQGQYPQSDQRLSDAQDRIDELFTQSISAHTARYFINDLTAPYQPAPYERAYTYYYRAMNFLSENDTADALVEANRAVYYLDHLRDSKQSGWRDDPFVQYFMSLVFESAGKRDDARIARTRAEQAYQAQQGGNLPAEWSRSALPEGWGEVVVVHANGAVPLKKTKTVQVSWNWVQAWISESSEGERSIRPEVKNAITAGLLGRTVTLAYPVLEKQPFLITDSEVLTAQGSIYPTYLMSDVSAAADGDLKENETATLLRMALRVAAKRVAAVQAKHAAEKSSQRESIGNLAEMFVSFLGALTEKADTRQWFTLPAQWRLTRFYVPGGTQDIILRFRDGFGNIIETHTFHAVSVPANGRVYLHYRTAL